MQCMVFIQEIPSKRNNASHSRMQKIIVLYVVKKKMILNLPLKRHDSAFPARLGQTPGCPSPCSLPPPRWPKQTSDWTIKNRVSGQWLVQFIYHFLGCFVSVACFFESGSSSLSFCMRFSSSHPGIIIRSGFFDMARRDLAGETLKLLTRLSHQNPEGVPGFLKWQNLVNIPLANYATFLPPDRLRACLSHRWSCLVSPIPPAN